MANIDSVRHTRRNLLYPVQPTGVTHRIPRIPTVSGVNHKRWKSKAVCIPTVQ